jgi:dTMP kinase
MFGAGLIGLVVGVVSYKKMKDRPNVSLWSDIAMALRGELGGITGATHSGIFISFEGGEGSGKSTQSKLLKEYLESIGETVLLTREPGGTDLGKQIRQILLANETGHISPRAEALMYAADRAHHVYSLIRPALDAGSVVITDRYLDSSIAYQGAGRVLQPAEVARISRWATEEPLEFHERVRQEFLNLANVDPDRYVVIDGRQSVEAIHAAIRERVAMLPLLKINKKAK